MVTSLCGVVHGLIHMVVHIRRAQLFAINLSPTMDLDAEGFGICFDSQLLPSHRMSITSFESASLC
ncbi:hypothetical protein LPB072_10640 [Hydrogenophaga crassostreae]|uniref:Uncharacterized protein n=1 Tax=Hydrogenophaga crassostreae TaxID=1763535 RepID=A0A1D8NVX6_9BURK|nr:hypothetical protein LPB072_10640 [Hydrogenophaga crassostreae]